MSANQEFSARGTHTCGNPPAGSSAAWALDVQAQNSLLTKTIRAENQGPGGSKLLVEDGHLLDGASSSGSFRSSIESLLLGENELSSVEPVKATEVQVTAANPKADPGEAEPAHSRLSALTLSSTDGSNMVKSDANLKSAIALTAMEKASGPGGNLVDSDVVMTQIAPACHATASEKTKLVPFLAPVSETVGTMVNPSSRSESTSVPMDTEQVPDTGVNLSKRQKKRQRQRNARMVRDAEAMATTNVAMSTATQTGAATLVLSSTPVAEAGKRNRSDDDPSDLVNLTDEATASAPVGKRKKKRRKVNKPESEVSNLGQQVTVTTGGASCSNRVPGRNTSGTSAAGAKNVGASAETSPPSDPPSSIGGEYAAAAASGMMVEICGDGQIQLSQKQLDFVDSQVWEAIGKSKDIPRFERMRVEHGILKVQCSGSQSREWLTKTVAAMPAFEGCKFVIRQTDKLQRLVRVSMLIPGPPREPHAIISRLCTLNEGLDTTHWRAYHYTKVGTDPKYGNASHLVLGVDPDSLKVIRSRYGMRLYLNLGRVLVTVLDSDKGKV